MRRLLCLLTMLATLSFSLGATLVRADQTTLDPAPPISFCLGATTHCVMPDFSLSVVNYDLDAKRWSGEVQTLSVGYALLFYSDQPWSSGIALHGAGRFKDGGPKYFAIVPTLVLMKYFEAGVTVELGDGYVSKSVTLGGRIPWDVVTGPPMVARFAASRGGGQ